MWKGLRGSSEFPLVPEGHMTTLGPARGQAPRHRLGPGVPEPTAGDGLSLCSVPGRESSQSWSWAAPVTDGGKRLVVGVGGAEAAGGQAEKGIWLYCVSDFGCETESELQQLLAPPVTFLCESKMRSFFSLLGGVGKSWLRFKQIWFFVWVTQFF